ncbi:Aste57867_630 [Aphanomyces stellatus]|uniref:Aste57867_630 protein n=1 Tax=Aphanomyces stellatus TaxID=120398 RepID=A0A485K3F1_9STRA|nr:hypothetical protein As57867_000629 [Aphanomyces stellatus]VFT77855.1 Aste57867_630 [Aphanomyces stellatus]
MPCVPTGRELTNTQRTSLYHSMIHLKANGRAAPGTMRDLCLKFGITRQAASKIWIQGQKTKEIHGCANIASQKTGSCGRPPKYTLEKLEKAIKDVPPFARSTFRSLAAATGVPLATLWSLLKKKKLQWRTSRLKPLLTPYHMARRFEFARSFTQRMVDGSYKWHDMMDRVNIDEKWFYITKVNRKYYMWHDEDTTSSDTRCGTARLDVGRLLKRRSKNRDRGTPVTVPITVTKNVYRHYLVDLVFPAIRKQWPGRRDAPIYVQHDNAWPHVENDDPEVLAAGAQGGWTIRLSSQPAMSPDFNILDLGFFNAIQSLQHHKVTRCIDDLVAAVHEAFGELKCAVLDKAFMTLQKVVEESLKMDGDNVYKLPHLKKDTTIESWCTFIASIMRCRCISGAGSIASSPSPAIIKALLQYIQEPAISASSLHGISSGYGLAAVLAAVSFASLTMMDVAFYISTKAAINAKTIVVDVVCAKKPRDYDCRRFAASLQRRGSSPLGARPNPLPPLALCLGRVHHGRVVRSCGAAVFAAVLGLGYHLATAAGALQKDIMALQANRVKLTTEIFQGIRVVKMYGWEASIQSAVATIRDKELRVQRRYHVLSELSAVSLLMAPPLSFVAVLLVYVAQGKTLTATVAFTALVYTNVARIPCAMFSIDGHAGHGMHGLIRPRLGIPRRRRS